MQKFDSNFLPANTNKKLTLFKYSQNFRSANDVLEQAAIIFAVLLASNYSCYKNRVLFFSRTNSTYYYRKREARCAISVFNYSRNRCSCEMGFRCKVEPQFNFSNKILIILKHQWFNFALLFLFQTKTKRIILTKRLFC